MAVRRAYSQGEIRSFLLEGFNLEPIYYSSEISQRLSDSCRPVSFDCVLERRRRELVDASLNIEIATVEVLVGVVTSLVKCSTWTHAKFLFGCGGFGTRDESSELVFEHRMFEVYHLLGSSPSLLSLDVSCNVGYARACYKHRSETLTVHDAPADRGFYTHFGAFAEALAGGVSRNSALKSLTLHTSHNSCHVADVKSLEVLFTSAIMSSVKYLVLRFPDCVAWNNCATVVNLVRRNTTLQKLTLSSTDSWSRLSRLKDVAYTWTSENHGRALQVKYSGTDFFLRGGLIEPLAAIFSLDYSPDSIFPRGTDLSSLHIILSLDPGISFDRIPDLSSPEWVQAFALVTSVASMSARSKTLKQVQVSYDWGRAWPPTTINLMWSRKKQAELSMQTYGVYKLPDAKSLEVLMTSDFMSSVEDLVLRFRDCVLGNSWATVVNLVRWNTTLEKLSLCSTDPNPCSGLKEVTYTWTSKNHGRALQVVYSVTDFSFTTGLIEPLAANFSLDHSPDSIFPRGTDLSILHLILSLDQVNRSGPDWMQTFRDNMIALVGSVATMSARSSTLKRVQLSYEWSRDWSTMNDLMWSCRKEVELLTQEKLREMVGNELRANTSLETLEVGFWKLSRRAQHVGGGTDEWHTSYRGPCLRTLSDEYVVKV